MKTSTLVGMSALTAGAERAAAESTPKHLCVNPRTGATRVVAGRCPSGFLTVPLRPNNLQGTDPLGLPVPPAPQGRKARSDRSDPPDQLARQEAAAWSSTA